MTGIHRKI